MDDTDSQEMPGALVEAYLAHERGTRELLDDLEKRSVEGSHEEVRERVRSFAEHNREPFFAVALALEGAEQFFDDIESQLGAGAADPLRDLAETYPSLVEPFKLVRMEASNGRKNPITSLDVTTGYSQEEEMPMIDYTAFSGGVKLYEHRGSPQELLQSAGYLVQATNDSLEAALDQGHSVDTEELSELIDRREKLESELGTLRDRIDQLRGSPVGDPDYR